MTTNTWQPPVLTSIPREIGEAMMETRMHKNCKHAVCKNTAEVKKWLNENGYDWYYWKCENRTYVNFILK